MLQRLFIENYALIAHLDITFESGFSVITGETGAGKSILLGALGVLMGGRAEAKSIKTGEKRCTIEGHFLVKDYAGMDEFFQANDLDFDGNECIIRREILATGKSRAFINDTPVNVNQLRTLSALLIDIHSQHQNLLLGDENFQLNILDLLAGNDKARNAYHLLYEDYATSCSRLKAYEAQLAKERTEQDYLKFQYEELAEVKLKAEEQSALEEEADMLAHAEEIKSHLFETSLTMNEDEHSLLTGYRNCLSLLKAIANVFPKAAELAERTESNYIELKDIAGEVDAALEHITFDPERQQEVNDRLNALYTLEQKHHVESVEELIKIQTDLEERLNSISNGDEKLTEMKAANDKLREQLFAQAATLTKTREKAARLIEQEIIKRLTPLGIPNIRFEVKLTPRPQPDATGIDKVAFFFSANKNVPLQDIAEIASGGEIARVMLSLKALISKAKSLPTILFDEIDTGVSGNIAERMALTMEEIASDGHQVISITHLPQIAARGAVHYRVFKDDTAETTNTHITRLKEEERIREIATMLSGSKLTEAAISNAKELMGTKKNR